MKKLILIIALLITGCNAHHSFMDNAMVGYVDSRAVVMFPAGERNGVKYYRPQFTSECPYNKYYQDNDSSTGCMVREARIADLHPYREHVSKVMPHHTDSIHIGLEGVNSPSHISDNL